MPVAGLLGWNSLSYGAGGRKGGYIKSFATKRKKGQVVSISLVQKAFINGMSTRKSWRLREALSLGNLFVYKVSEITRGLDEQMKKFLTRALCEEYPLFCRCHAREGLGVRLGLVGGSNGSMWGG
ncbi:MAG: transposase [Candidatus Aminicenantes bacterium]|nr:transposase [Candidatus Aminicenantes bacterium]